MKRYALSLIAALVLGLSLASAAAAAPGGNSANAKLCQKGGWATLARTEDAGTAFLSQGECVSYGAQGGTIVAYEEPVVYNPSISIVMAVAQEYWCAPQVTATGFLPNTTYDVDAYFWGSLDQEYQITTDANGSYFLSSISFIRNYPATFQIVIGGVASPVVEYYC